MLEKNVFDFLVNVIGSKSGKIERCYLTGSISRHLVWALAEWTFKSYVRLKWKSSQFSKPSDLKIFNTVMRICLYISNNFKQIVLSGQTELWAHILICFTSEKVFSFFRIRKLLAEDSIWEILRNLWEILRNNKHLNVMTDWCFWVILYVWEQFLNHYTRPRPLDYTFLRNFWEISKKFPGK